MPSRVRFIDLDHINDLKLQFANGVDFELVAKGRRVEQVAVVTLPQEAARIIALRIGPEGDPLRLNSEGQTINLTGEDQTAGVFLVSLATNISWGGVVEFAFGLGG